MTTPQRPADELVVPADIYRRASVADFLGAVAEHVPGLAGMSDDRKIATAYALAHHEAQGPRAGAAARADGARFGYAPDDLADLLALGYTYLFPALASDVELLPLRARLGARARALFTRRK